jgi:hypothetical protein
MGDLLDAGWDGSADCIVDSSLGVMLLSDDDLAASGFDVGAQSFLVQGLEREEVDNSDLDSCIEG